MKYRDIVSTACLVLLLLCLACSQSCAAPRILLILCDGLTINDLHDNRYPQLYAMAESGAVGLMNGVTPGPRFPGSALLTLASGEPQAAEPTDAMVFGTEEPVAGELDTAAQVYRRRTGFSLPPGCNLVHLGIAPLIRRKLNTATLGALLAAAHPPVRALIIGNADADTLERTAALLTLNAWGVGVGDVGTRPQGEGDLDAEKLSRYALGAEAGLFVIRLGDMSRTEAARPHLPLSEYQPLRQRALSRLDALLYLLQVRLAESGPDTDLVLVSPTPPGAPGDLPWQRLAPILARGPDFPTGLLTSATTRTEGLVANIDLAPTLLSILGVPIPATVVGRSLRVRPYGDGGARLALLAQADFVALLNAQAMTRVMVPLGGLCLLLTLLAFTARRCWGAQAGRRGAPVLILALNLPLALLFAPILVPPTLLEYGLRIAAWMGGLTVVCYGLARVTRLQPPVGAALLCLVAVTTDTLLGQTLMKQSLLSGYALSGIRYYGVGNEYLGVLLGLTLAGGFAWLDDSDVPLPSSLSPGSARRSQILMAVWIGLALLLGWPGLGANAGSLIVSAAGFGIGMVILSGRKPHPWLGIAWSLAGLALAFLFGALDARFAGAESSHAGAALTAASQGRGMAYLVEIALRKLAMNLRLLQSPFLLLGATVVALIFLAAWRLLSPQMQAVVTRRPWTARSGAALLAAGAASLLFKDSGVVTTVFLAGAACLIFLWYTVQT